MRRIAVASLIACALLALSCAHALAHAYLVESRPADGDLLKQQPAEVELLFNEPVELVTASHVDPQGAVGRLVMKEGGDPRLRLALPEALAQGSHLVSWRVTSQDGHTVSGSIVFSIGRASGGGGAPGNEEPTIHLSPLSAPLVLARFLLLVGLAFGVGAAVFRAIVSPARKGGALALAALGGGALAAFVSIGLQGADAHGLGLAALNDRAVWRSGLRLPLGVGASIALAAFAFAASSCFLRGRAMRAAGVLALALSALSLVFAGHARQWRPEALTPALAAAHVIAAIGWAGALIPLLAAMRQGDFAPVLARFSRLAAPVYIALLATGAGLAATQFLASREVFATAWGLALAAKLGLVALVTLLAILNRYLFTGPALAGDVIAKQRLRRSIRVEAALAGLILAAASVWRLTPPASALGPPQERAFNIHIHGAEAMASMTIRPARPGPVQIRIEPKAPDLSPLRVHEVELRLTPDAPGVEPIRRRARAASNSYVWEVDGLTIPAPGTWRVRVDLLVDEFARTQLDAVIVLRP